MLPVLMHPIELIIELALREAAVTLRLFMTAEEHPPHRDPHLPTVIGLETGSASTASRMELSEQFINVKFKKN